jgi:hypothetical protein
MKRSGCYICNSTQRRFIHFNYSRVIEIYYACINPRHVGVRRSIDNTTAGNVDDVLYGNGSTILKLFYEG